MARKVHSICCICGKESDLTFEHIPPRAAFNHFNLKLYDFWGYLTQNKTRYNDRVTQYLQIPRKPCNPAILDFREGIPDVETFIKYQKEHKS